MLEVVKFRRILGLFAAALVAVAVAACSGSTAPTSSPANTVPSSVVFYASVTVQPSSSELQTLEQLVNRIGGKGTAGKLLTRLDQALAKPHNGVSYAKDVEPWLGQEIGVAVTKLPKNPQASSSAADPYVGLIFPTANPAAAKQALPTLTKGMPKTMTAEVHGNYVLAGGKQAVAAIAATSQGNSLASNSSYQADLAKLEPNSLATLYVNSHSFTTFMESAIKRAGGGSSQLLQSLPKVPENASAMMGLSVTSNTVRLDIASSNTGGTPPASPADVSGLPGDSWLAVSTPSFTAAQLKQLSSAMSAMGAMSSSASHGGMTLKAAPSKKTSFSAPASSPTYVAVNHSSSTKSLSQLQAIVPLLFKNGLGPMHFSLAGTSMKSLRAGLSLTENSASSASQFEQMIYSFAKLGHAQVTGTPPSFSIAVNKQLKVDVGTSGKDVVATRGYPNAAAFDSPSSTLADNSVYQQAASQLPSGSHVSVFVNADGLSTLVASDAKASKQPFAKVLKRFSYAIVGGTQGHERIVVGLH